jgi:hypothetical protein
MPAADRSDNAGCCAASIVAVHPEAREHRSPRGVIEREVGAVLGRSAHATPQRMACPRTYARLEAAWRQRIRQTAMLRPHRSGPLALKGSTSVVNLIESDYGLDTTKLSNQISTSLGPDLTSTPTRPVASTS